jgi:putative ATP-binding cassette transporter
VSTIAPAAMDMDTDAPRSADHGLLITDRVTAESAGITRSYNYDRLFFRRLYQLSKPYWVRDGAYKSWLTLLTLLATVAIYSVAGAWITWLTKDQTDALIAGNAARFWPLLGITAALTALRFGISALQTLIDGSLDLHWHRWLGQHVLSRYFERRHYYKIATDSIVENPDQRIQEELSPFCAMMSSFPRLGFGTLVDAAVQMTVLLAISPLLFWAVAAFVAIKFVLLVWIYTPVTIQNYEVVEADADFRSGIRHVMAHAETVAFYGGETPEQSIIVEHLKRVVRKRLHRLYYAVRINLLQGVFSTAWLALPLLLLAPSYFHHHIEYGTIAQSTAAMALTLQSLSLFLQFIPNLSLVAYKVSRLGELVEAIDSIDSASKRKFAQPRIAYRLDAEIRLDHLTLSTPNDSQVLIRDLSLRIPMGENWVISGRTGVGKSSLLRAMAGLWTRGSGSVAAPGGGDLFFLPQKPYMMQGTLRQQLCYPSPDSGYGDDALQAVLARVRLGDLAARHGGLDSRQDWARVLSLGEQQRIAIARALLASPRYLFLDEATTAVDFETEQHLYRALADAGITCISVGHRNSILAYHQRELRLCDGGAWQQRRLGSGTSGSQFQPMIGENPAHAPAPH